MVQSSTVSSDAAKFNGFVTDIPQKFADLKSSWQGYSFTELSNKVTALVGEMKIVNEQMAVLQKVCAWYESYCKAVDSYNDNQKLYEDYCNQVDPEEEDKVLNDKISLVEEEMKNNIKNMEDCVRGAKDELAKFKKDTIKEVTFQSIGVSV